MLAWVFDPRAREMNETRLGKWMTSSLLLLLAPRLNAQINPDPQGYLAAVAEREQAFGKELKRQEN